MKVGDSIYFLGVRGLRIAERPIIGETSKSWITYRDYEVRPEDVSTSMFAIKISKKELAADMLYGTFSSREAAEDWLWMMENRWKIADEIKTTTDSKALRQIAEIIGYKEKP